MNAVLLAGPFRALALHSFHQRSLLPNSVARR